MRVKSLAQEHNTMSQASHSGVKHTNHEVYFPLLFFFQRGMLAHPLYLGPLWGKEVLVVDVRNKDCVHWVLGIAFYPIWSRVRYSSHFFPLRSHASLSFHPTTITSEVSLSFPLTTITRRHLSHFFPLWAQVRYLSSFLPTMIASEVSLSFLLTLTTSEVSIYELNITITK